MYLLTLSLSPTFWHIKKEETGKKNSPPSLLLEPLLYYQQQRKKKRRTIHFSREPKAKAGIHKNNTQLYHKKTKKTQIKMKKGKNKKIRELLLFSTERGGPQSLLAKQVKKGQEKLLGSYMRLKKSRPFA